MSRTVQCIKLGQESEGLEKPPFKGELGQKVFDTVSKTAWRQWLEHSKMLINEYRLDVTSEQGQRVWMTELEKFFWGEGATKPADYVAPKDDHGGHGHGGHGHGGHGH
ncbi:MAG: oxidative damage protection protein [Pseudomonadota bacterium]|jgi:Fe-S cluster biosynthesis and repair protein YggX